MNLIDNIIRGISIENILIQAINHLYTKGPTSITDMEVLSYIAIYHPEIFNKHIDSILTYLAIFYKNPTANTLQDLVFQQYKEYKIKNRFKCHFGIGCLQRGFMRNYSMTTRATPRTTTLATMIRHMTTMITRRIIDMYALKSSTPTFVNEIITK